MRTLLIGFDAFDPNIFERLCQAGRMPHLARYLDSGNYARFTVANPPQSEVSWTSIATGLNPGAHGLFDFVHRDPATYGLNVSLLPMKKGLAGTSFVPPYDAHTIFDDAVSRGYPATALWWPATFPARRESPVRTIPGLGTPDIRGRLGVGSYFTTDADRADIANKIPIHVLEEASKDCYRGQLEGPERKKRGTVEPTPHAFQIERLSDQTARLSIGKRQFGRTAFKQQYTLKCDEWSPIIELSFRVGLIFSVKAITRIILVQNGADVALYFLPLQIHPLKSPWPYGTPGGFVKDTWQAGGPFLSLGWPQDTTALEEGLISDEHFLDLCRAIVKRREQALMHHLDGFEEGILACVFDTLDRVQHMFLHSHPELVEEWYVAFDHLFGRIERRLESLPDTRLVLVSDHGFAPFDYKVDLNRWLEEAGYLTAKDQRPTRANRRPSSAVRRRSLADIDWARTRAYAVGLNSLYLNLQDREGQGIVSPDEREALMHELATRLQRWQGPDGNAVVAEALLQEDAFEGPYSAHAPDLVVGYAPGYRASRETGLGKWGPQAITANTDHWAADHCIAASAVPGIIIANQNLLSNFPSPSYRDIPALTVDATPRGTDNHRPPSVVRRPQLSDDDAQAIEERLKGLGYL